MIFQKRLRLFLLMIILSSSSPFFGQDLSDYYSTMVQEGGDLYFIFPFDEYKNTEDGSHLLYDMTYREGQDSVTINFTYFTDQPLKADSFHMITPTADFAGPSSKIYQDYDGKKWENRFSANVPFAQLQQAFKAPDPPSIAVDAEGTQMKYEVKLKKWATYQSAVDKILYIIQPE